MYKLVFLILTLSGFLIYKAVSIKVKARPVSVPVSEQASQPAIVAKKTPAASPKASPGPSVSAVPAEAPIVAESPPPSTQREQFDSLAEVYNGGGGIEAGKLTQDEREKYENTKNLIQKVEAEDAARRNFKPGKTKRPEDLTPEEHKLFDVYNTEENANERK